MSVNPADDGQGCHFVSVFNHAVKYNACLATTRYMDRVNSGSDVLNHPPPRALWAVDRRYNCDASSWSEIFLRQVSRYPGISEAGPSWHCQRRHKYSVSIGHHTGYEAVLWFINFSFYSIFTFADDINLFVPLLFYFVLEVVSFFLYVIYPWSQGVTQPSSDDYILLLVDFVGKSSGNCHPLSRASMMKGHELSAGLTGNF